MEDQSSLEKFIHFYFNKETGTVYNTNLKPIGYGVIDEKKKSLVIREQFITDSIIEEIKHQKKIDNHE